jgi:hypothetical protein
MRQNITPDHVTPVGICERLIGPPPVIAAILGYNRTAIPQWRHANGLRAAGDFPSATIMRQLLAHSDAHRLGLTAGHLIQGAPEAEIAAILQARPATKAAAAQPPVPFPHPREVAA